MDLIQMTPDALSEHLEYEHFLVDGMYMRVMHLDKGMFIEGVTHLKEGFALLTKGAMIIKESLTDVDVHIEAPCYFMVPKGSKKYGLALEDVTFITVERTDNTELNDIEKELYKEDLITSNMLNYNKQILTLGGIQ